MKVGSSLPLDEKKPWIGTVHIHWVGTVHCSHRGSKLCICRWSLSLITFPQMRFGFVAGCGSGWDPCDVLPWYGPVVRVFISLFPVINVMSTFALQSVTVGDALADLVPQALIDCLGCARVAYVSPSSPPSFGRSLSVQSCAFRLFMCTTSRCESHA